MPVGTSYEYSEAGIEPHFEHVRSEVFIHLLKELLRNLEHPASMTSTVAQDTVAEALFLEHPDKTTNTKTGSRGQQAQAMHFVSIHSIIYTNKQSQTHR